MSNLSWKQWASDGFESEVGVRPENWVKHASRGYQDANSLYVMRQDDIKSDESIGMGPNIICGVVVKI